MRPERNLSLASLVFNPNPEEKADARLADKTSAKGVLEEEKPNPFAWEMFLFEISELVPWVDPDTIMPW